MKKRTACQSSGSGQMRFQCRLESIFRYIRHRNQTQDVGIVQIVSQLLNNTQKTGIATFLPKNPSEGYF